MKTITIPKRLIKESDLVAVSRREYEEFFNYKKRNSFTHLPTQSKGFNLIENKFLNKTTFSYKKSPLLKEEIFIQLADHFSSNKFGFSR